jgi:hypothetical protein
MGTPVARMTIRRAPSMKRRLISSLVTTANVKMYFGTYIFFRREALSITDVNEREVEMDMKEKSICPIRR